MANIEVVSVLYRALSLRSILGAKNASSSKLLKDYLKAVLALYVNCCNAPLTTIGKVERLRSYPQQFGGATSFEIFYKF